ncbi:MAG: hypothetical protein ABR587_02655 [Candidatus Binatia bacterium]
MSSPTDLDRTLLRVLLDEQVEKFRLSLERENPGLSATERERYLRAVRLFCSQILGAAPKTHGRKARPTKTA